MRATRLVPMAALALCAAVASAQPPRGELHLGYVYPAGAQQGAKLRITAGGQSLQGVSVVYVSGQGVQASVVEYVRALNNKQLGDIAMHLRALTKQRLAEMQGKQGAAPAQPAPPRANEEPLPALPDHPLLRGLEQKSLAELAALRDILFNPKKQPNMQIAETVAIDLSVDPAAPPGDREIRLGTPAGLTNPMLFQVGAIPESWEQEPNDPRPNRPATVALALPVTLNGQIQPGDVDRFRILATQGQRLVVRTQARRLVPYLADAVPGWFQAAVALYDAKGSEVAYVDDYRFDPDPVLFYQIPQAGEYEVEIRDSIYRGREDFVYRISVGELPFVTQLFPLGGPVEGNTVAAIGGWNLSVNQLTLDTQPGGGPIRQTVLQQNGLASNPIAYAVDDLPECTEKEPNEAAASAQPIGLPQAVNGRIGKPGDTDVFKVKGRPGDEIVAEVLARKLGSPLDSLLRVTDGAGETLALNDDCQDKASGLLTHHADSYVRTKLPQDGVCYVRVADSQDHGGEAFGYRLRVSAPRPDFALRVTPSSLNVRPGGAVAFWAHVLREDGFDGDIELALKDAPAGLALQGARIPSGRDSLRLTLTAPQIQAQGPIPLHLEGRAQIGGQTVTHTAVPAEDMMQAFAYRHLVPSQELLAALAGGGRFGPIIQPMDNTTLRLPAGGSAQVRISAPGRAFIPSLQLELSDPPKGLSLGAVSPVFGGFVVTVKADAESLAVGYADNLILEAFTELQPKRPDGTLGEKRRVPLGVLPAIPVEIVKG
ncbi:MAG: hypothetical protein FJX75_01410 [Armatimonadetes bacterium]|nr:hypothetical protein [Armatimonadota bacterium]